MRLEVGVHALHRPDPERGVVVIAVIVTQTDRPPVVACELVVCLECGRTRETHRRRVCLPAGW